MMELNLDIISNYLPNHYIQERFGQSNTSRTLTMPVIYEPASGFENNLLYVARVDTLPAVPPNKKISIICTGQRPPSAWLDTQIIWISNCSSFYNLFNQVIEIFMKFNTWANGINFELGRIDGIDLEKILRLGSEMIQNTIALTNNTLIQLFDVSYIDSTEEPGYKIEVSKPNAPVSNIMEVKGVCRWERMIKESYFSSVPFMGQRIFCRNIFHFERFIGCVSITEDHHTFNDGDLAIVDYFFSLFHSAFIKYVQNEPSKNSPSSMALNNLFNGFPLGPYEQMQLAPGQSNFWVCFILSAKRDSNYMPEETLCATLNVLLSDVVISVARDNEVWGLFRIYPEQKSKADLEYFEDYIAKMGYVAGMSGMYYDYKSTEIHLKFARYAMNMGRKELESGHLFRFEKYVLDYIITRYYEDTPVEMFFPAGLLYLIEHNKSSQVDYIHTLRVYMENNMSLSRTAEDLFLHRSSMLSRINHIKKFLNLDLSVPKNQLYLRLCLYMMGKDATS